MNINGLPNNPRFFSLLAFIKSFSLQLKELFPSLEVSFSSLSPKIFIYTEAEYLSYKLLEKFSLFHKNAPPLYFHFKQEKSLLILRTKYKVIFSLKITHSIISNKSPLFLLDDDPIIRLYWKLKAKESKLPLISFSQGHKLLNFYSKKYKNSLYFLDEHLKETHFFPGHEVKKILTQRGVKIKNIAMISSQYSSHPFPKACPWEDFYFGEISLKIK